MKALSIQQPWAWAILNAGKDIENRDWYTPVRGRILIHAGKKIDKGSIGFIEDLCHISIPRGIGAQTAA
ncbi:MAG: ASCH domain-containing protein [Thiothrix sp.]|uniref:ASCH domain-containing protein n=1 Tax=Thiothrix sp. TaxID=1032 RepID=UPI00260B3029|nr:ASCH domain-containing protein [Thiothrix sp.]MDD5394961.1 ASCH domain-containing protein [Thiothrix sp.]